MNAALKLTTRSNPSISGRCIDNTRLVMKSPFKGQLRGFNGLGALPIRRSVSQRAASRTLVLAASTPQRSLSFSQRWRALQFAFKEKRDDIAKLPVVLAITTAVAAIRAKLQPLYTLAAAFSKAKEEFNDRYNQFLAEETKAKWTWSKRNAKELAFWDSVPPYIFFLGVTLMYECLVPVSFTLALVLPLYYSWVVWDQWWTSPVFVGMLIMAPMKFVPWGLGYFCWLWPGII